MMLMKALLATAWLAVATSAVADEELQRGKYLYDAADCGGCHGGGQSGVAPAGGRALKTPFGLFHGPNISSDRQNGIGAWSGAQFAEALRHGIAPGGKQLFPVFPFPSFSGMTDRDIADLYVYIQSLPAAAQPSQPHELRPPFGWRFLMLGWRMLFFTPGPLAEQPDQDREWNRGHYLVQAVVHCEECHTPRNRLGALDRQRSFSGNIGGPDGQNAPNITSDIKTGIGSWTVDEIAHLLKTGETPDFDSVASGMAEVVRGTRSLTDDRHAIAVYLKSVAPIETVRRPLGRP